MNLNHIAKKPFFDLFYKTPCMPQLARAAFQESASYNHASSSNKGGVNGALRLKERLALPENKEYKFAMDRIHDIKVEGNHITDILSYSDLIQLGGYCAVEYCGGPSMIFRMGRKDVEASDDA
jgi:cytochrome c peroxidase